MDEAKVLPDAIEPVGVIPGGGGATRLAPLPCSKELLTIGFRDTPAGPRPKTIVNYLIDGFRAAGARRTFWLLDRRKVDILSYFGSGGAFGMQLAYVATEGSPSVVHTVDSAFGFLRDQHVLFGFPDIVFEPADALGRLWERLRRSRCDVVLGAVPAPAEQIADRVQVGARGELSELRVKPLDGAGDAWILAAWTPRFTAFLHDWLQRHTATHDGSELYLGHALEAARRQGMSIEVETFRNGSFIDAGTAEGLRIALARYGAVGNTSGDGRG